MNVLFLLLAAPEDFGGRLPAAEQLARIALRWPGNILSLLGMLGSLPAQA